MSYRIRQATLQDQPVLNGLMARSIRELGAGDYTPEQIDAALRGAFGIDTALIKDETYFVIVTDNGEIVACGGWSKRRTLFGSDARADRDESNLDPDTDAAKIRAFFVDPAHARRGLGRMLLDHCESQAAAAGFTAFELMATLPGVRLYEKCGYQGTESFIHPLSDGLTIQFVPMKKSASGQTQREARPT
jgi:GNAT superfamily N-acetyltransferase